MKCLYPVAEWLERWAVTYMIYAPVERVRNPSLLNADEMPQFMAYRHIAVL